MIWKICDVRHEKSRIGESELLPIINCKEYFDGHR
jgi:hypothetical protein